MSAIRYFGQIPHIVRYGMHDEKAEKCWIWFWRNGVRFKIFVNREDVQDTPFYEQWKPLLREHKRGEMPLSRWSELQWHPLCDLVISTSMPILRQLAPERVYWTTLGDYLHTPAYQLKITKSGPGNEIIAEVQEGPKDTGAYELVPVSHDKLPLPDGIPQYQSEDLTVLNKDKDWRRKPEKVSTPDGKTFFFLGCEQDVRSMPSQQVSNPSLDAIRTKLKLREALTGNPDVHWPDGIPQVHGVVIDAPTTEVSADPSSTEAIVAEKTIAGVLITWIPRGKTLDRIVRDLTEAQKTHLDDNVKAWRSRIEQTVEQLHHSGVFLGGRDDWLYLNQHTVLIDADGNSWLNTSRPSLAADVSAEQAEAGMAADKKAVIDLFEKWLPDEMSKKRSS